MNIVKKFDRVQRILDGEPVVVAFIVTVVVVAAARFGFHLDSEMVLTIGSLVAAVMARFARSKVSPVVEPHMLAEPEECGCDHEAEMDPKPRKKSTRKKNEGQA